MTSRISAAVNLVFIGALIYVWNSQRPVAISPVLAPPRLETHAQSVEPEVASTVAPQAAPFRWSQLLTSNDYRNFVANLRAAGCPEPTVEDIVRGDAERAFYAKRVELNVDATQPGIWSVQSQRNLVDRLLGRSPAADVGPVAVVSDHQPAAESAILAAFLQNVDLTGPGATEQQKQQIANLRQNLLQQISGPDFKAEQAESVLGGLFGIGVAGQYDQYLAAHQSPQN